MVVRSSGGSGRGLQVSPLILGSQLSPESARQSQQTGPPTQSQSWVGQSRRVGAHRQTLGVLGEVLGLELLLQEGRKQKGGGGGQAEERSQSGSPGEAANQEVIERGGRKEREPSAAT